MFGFQRVGDLIWAGADQRTRGFLFGATAGRTTLGGEGLQHQDGSSLVMASMVPNCRVWDPAFAGELAVILRYGMTRMLTEQRDEFHYVTLMNESYPMPSLAEDVEADLLCGMYCFKTFEGRPAANGLPAPSVRLLGSGTILLEVIAAAEILATDWGIGSQVFSVTSFGELAREAREAQRADRLDELRTAPASPTTLDRLLPGHAPVIAATDHVRAWPQLIAEYIDARYVTLGTDGFGRSDTREQLRRFFEVDRYQVVLAAIRELVRAGTIAATHFEAARERYAGAAVSTPPWER
jgi:pyruvate dehydrogenase E1 component